jgi:phosphoglycolate phosphatase
MHVVFDLDGVLLDSESDLSWLDRALDRTLAEFDLPRTDENRRKLYPANVPDFRAAARSFGVDAEELWRTRDDCYTDEKLDAIERGDLRPFEDVDRLYDFREESDLEHNLHVLSNSPEVVVETFVRTYDFEDLFEVTIGRGHALEDLDDLKPSTEPFDRLRHRLGNQGDDPRFEYVYVGDTDSDREFAGRVGIDYVHLDRDGTGADPGAERTMDGVCARLQELVGSA